MRPSTSRSSRRTEELMRATLIVLGLFAAVSAHAAFEFEPIAPTDRSYIHLQVREMWRDGCVPTSPGVTHSGNVIEVMWVIPGGGCPLAFTRWNKIGRASCRERVYVA